MFTGAAHNIEAMRCPTLGGTVLEGRCLGYGRIASHNKRGMLRVMMGSRRLHSDGMDGQTGWVECVEARQMSWCNTDRHHGTVGSVSRPEQELSLYSTVRH